MKRDRTSKPFAYWPEIAFLIGVVLLILSQQSKRWSHRGEESTIPFSFFVWNKPPSPTAQALTKENGASIPNDMDATIVVWRTTGFASQTFPIVRRVGIVPLSWANLYRVTIDRHSAAAHQMTDAEILSAVATAPSNLPEVEREAIRTQRPWTTGPLYRNYLINALVLISGLTGLLLIAWAVRRMWRRRMLRLTQHTGLCDSCGYPIGQSTVCTECGRAVTPEATTSRH